QLASAVIEGRVLNSAKGEYVGNARLTVEGTLLETFTQADGTYRLTNVPSGSATVKAFFTGFPVHSRSVTVTAGQTARHDIDFAVGMKGIDPARDAEIVRLSEFLVSTTRDMDGAAI